jgi:hypothetical protein
MTLPVFGFLTDAKDAINEFLHNCLLVAGAFLVGYLLGGVIGWALGKYILRQKEPDGLKKIGRPVGGVILALIVALIVFTGKGKPHGEGGEGKGNPDPNAGKNAAPKTEPKVDVKLPPVKPPDVKPTDTVVWVTILEGDAVPAPGRFYRIDNEVKTLPELEKVLETKGKITLGILFNKDTPPGDPRLVTDLTNWATGEAGLQVVLPPRKPPGK